MLKVGMKHTEKMVVDRESTAAHVGSGGLEVFATPSMIALMERTCKNCVDGQLEAGKGTVGISISTNHKAATPLGMEVICECELVEIDRSRLSFEVKCFDEIEQIGEGKHERFIVDNEKFLENVNKKIENSKK
ncbi:MAG: thioesterase family protein [Peptostreptococcus sp.]|uniref:thioesterase family protein n=1 Tax=Peptostreptococcus sp. TaxID=1262 RepID=UPI002FC7BB20